MGLYGFVWIYIYINIHNIYGFDMDLTWIYMDLYGFIYIYIYVWILYGFNMGLYGFMWNYMDLYMIWYGFNMDLYGFIRIYMDLYLCMDFTWILYEFDMKYGFISFYIILYFLPSYSKSMRMISLSCFIPERCLWASLYIPGISLCIFVGFPHHINFWIQTNKKHYSHGTPKKALKDN
jgi:hypothetical protein